MIQQYITVQEIKDNFGKLIADAYYDANLLPSPGVNDAWIENDLDSVAAYIDGFILKQYENGITGVRSMLVIRDFMVATFAYKAYSKLYDWANIPQSILDQKNNVDFRLKDIASGAYFLPDENQNPKGSVVSYKFDSQYLNKSSTRNII